ncbi:hypothetical protein OAF63_05140 [Saprospiraceae bacterium]|jgi:hypothetical protein|nr:hypothetical protein [Saprospiraceae bacterium]
MKKTIIFSILIALTFGLFGQENNSLKYKEFTKFKLTDGNTYLGTILEENDDYVTIRTEAFAELKITKSSIVSREIITGDKLNKGEYWFENPNATRNLFGPTGYGLRKGEGYYQNFLLFYNSVSYGFTDNITVGVGLIPFSFGDGLFYTITPKVSFPIKEDKFNIGAGVLIAGVGSENVGIAYGVATVGSRDKNFSIGLGYGFNDGELADQPTITVSGMLRLAKKFGLVTENWIIDGEALFTLSGRLIFEAISVDIGFANTSGSGIFPGFPLAGITVPFGRK